MQIWLFIVSLLPLAISQYCLFCDSSSCSPPCTFCSTGYSLIGNLLCVDTCPTNSAFSSTPIPTCSTPSGEIFLIDFTTQKDLTDNKIGNFLNPSGFQFNNPNQNTPLPTLDRGFYFAATSSIANSNNYIPSYLFTMNIWIFPISSSGVIFSVKIGSSEYIKIEASTGDYYISLLLKNQLSPGTDDLVIKQLSSLSNAWEQVTFQFVQTMYNSIDLTIIINNNPTLQTISDREANFPNGSYDWVIGDATSSFEGFIYWIQVNSDNTIFFPTVSPPICLNNNYWDGSNCQTCGGTCSVWPWCIRSENCFICKSIDCTACNGYETEMCTSCSTGIVPGCCDALCDSCTQTWACTTCQTGKFLIDGVCLNSCPYGFGSCSTNTGILISTDFNTPFAGSYGAFVTGTDPSSYQFFTSPETVDPVPSQNRGLFFSSGKYLIGSIDLSHTFSISLWIRPTSGDILGDSLGDLKVSSSGSVSLILNSWDNTATTTLSNSVSISASSWKYLSFSVDFSNKKTTLIVYSDNSPSASSSINDYVFRPASNDQLFIGKSFYSNYNGFVSYFKLWGGVISDFSGEMGDGGCGNGNGISCLWNCGFLFWGSACTACDGGCTLGCVLNGNCNICEDNLCQICSSFDSGSCSQCITNASGNPCVCNTGYYKPTGLSTCSACHTSCTACSGPGYYSCTACPTGTYLLRWICMNTCPSQYTQDSTLNVCTQITNLVISGTFYEIIVLDIISTFQVGQKNNNLYPSYDSNDPIPSYNRGYYFKSSSYLFSAGNHMSPYFSLNFWIYPTAGGTLFRKSSTLSYISISIASGTGIPSASLTLSDASTLSSLTAGVPSVLNSWNYLSIVGQVSSGKMSLIMYINNALATSSTSSNLAYLYDLGDLSIGKSSGGFVGFLWSFSAYNDEATYNADWNPIKCGGLPCPSGITLPMCSSNSAYLDTSTSTCTSCDSNCGNGCRTSISCGLCQMPPCYSCLSFSGPCTQCVSNASPDGNGGCVCDDQYFWYPTTLKCDLCDRLCKTCLGTTYFECTECYSWNNLVGINCMYTCPYGFGTGCTPVSTPVMNEFFNSNLQWTYGVFKTKMDTNRYNLFQTLDNNDAVTPVQRGLFINEAIYLQTNSFWLNHDISVGIWVNTLTDGNILSYFSSLYNYDFVFSTDGSLLYQLCDRWTTKFKASLSSAAIPSDAWNYLSFTISYGYSSTNVAIYANGNSVTTHTNYNLLFRPKATSSLRINCYYNCFTGYIYSFQLWNVLVTDFSSWIDDNICGTGLTSTCLYPYTSALYNDATTCASCDTSLTGCLRNILCNQCDDPLCAKCSNFSPGTCQNCVANAAGAPSPCVCNVGYFTMYNYICWACPTGCDHCLSYLYNSCTSCFSGYYLNNGICVQQCPDGYTENTSTNNCDPPASGSGAYFIDFYGLIKLDTIDSLNIGSDNTNTYPNYDANDPAPAINRGYYFGGSNSASMIYTFAPTYTISVWLKALSQGGTVLMKHTTNPEIQVRLNSNGQVTLNCSLTSFWTTNSINITTSTNVLNSWYFFSATASLFSDTSQMSNLSVYGATTFNVYINGVVDSTPTTAALSYVQDSNTGAIYIGADNSNNNGFTGFIDRINLYTDANSYGLDYVTTGCSGSCTKCPLTLVCLSECLINTYPGTTCGNCLSSCTDGCINGLTCRICKQSTCLSCDEFTGDCYSCIPNAYLDTGSCYCNPNAVFDIPTQSCIFCDDLCATCASSALFECSTCVTGNILMGNLCLRECPYGFSSSGCGSVSTAVIDQTFYGDFVGSYGNFVTGTSAVSYQFWNSPESVDPTPAYKRGLYFAPSQFLYSNVEVYLSYSFSMGVWVYTITNGDIIYKQTFLKLASNGLLTVLLENPSEVTTPSISPAISSLSGWNYISFTVVSTSTITTITVYSNNVAKTPVTANSMIFRDQVGKNLYIGKSTTLTFKGFIYWFTLWNVPITDFSSQVNDLCGTGLGKSCLWTCDINNYYTGSACSSCSSCTLGCRRSLSCYICFDPLCTTCTGFEIGECTACVSNATPTAGACTCNAYYWVSADGLSCSWACTTGCATCTGNLVYTQCITCKTNFYLLNNQCFSSCPTGYTQDATLNQCTNAPTSSIVTLALQNLIRLDTVDVFTVGSAASAYPSFDSADPIPSIGRGYYFTATKYMTSTTNLIISPWHTINIWAKINNQGQVISQLNGAALMMGISIDSAGLITFSLLLEDGTTGVTLTGPTNLFFSWHNIVFYGDIVNGYTIAYYVLDGVAKSNISSSNKQPFISVGLIVIGKQSLSSSFTGFLWSSKIYNDNSHSLSEWITSGCPSECTTCPSEKICPDNCAFANFYSTACTACSGSCSPNGCRSTLTCRLCKQKECLTCVDFTGDCGSCITNASLNNGNCACNSNSIWVQSSATCEICDNLCSSCAGTYYFECATCTATETMVGTVCLHQCPTGFGSSGCTSSSSTIVDTSLYDTFQGSYGIFNVGASPSTYYFSNTPDTDDPIPAVSRGLYFSSGKFLESSVALYLSSSFSLGLWILVESAGDILEKQNSFTITGSGLTKVSLQNPLQATSQATAAALTFTGWGYISISVKYLNGGTTITNYINNTPGTPVASTSKIFRDASSSMLFLGKSSSSTSFSGFIYWVTVWNSVITDFSAWINNLCGTGLGSSCLWNCDITKYYTGSTCNSCSTCPLGCRRLNSCNVCYDSLCTTCSFFSSGLCTACVTHASVLTGGICACNANYIPAADGFSCIWGCYAGCASCSGTLYTQCTSCFSGWYLFDSMCLTACPTGFTQDSGLNECTSPPSSPIISLQFQNLIMLDTVNTFTIGSSTSKYPTYDANDPYPSIYRGYYFTSASSATSTSSYIISPLYSITLWVKPISGGYLLWQLPSMLKLSFTTPGVVSMILTLQDTSTISYTSTTILFNSWHNIAVTGDIVNTKTRINYYLDGALVNYLDSPSSSPFISSGLVLVGSSDGTNGFTGFLWSLFVYNDNTHALSEWKTAGCASGCSSCPSELLCPDSCDFNKYYSSSCVSCLASCSSYGCRSSLTCRLCKNKECLTCDYFDGNCFTCITNAQLISGACSCNDNSIWIQTSETCEICDNYCQTCAGTYYFECSSCIAGKFKVENACINDCPTGFTLPGCVSSTSVVIDENFDTIFQGSYGIFTTASSSSSYYFYNTPETYDPIPAYYRGLYFSSGSYLESNIPIYLSHSFSVGLWVFVKGTGSVFQKQDFLYMNEVGVFTITLESPLQSTTTLSTAALTFTNWNYISLTIKYSLGATTITVYLNNSPQTPVVSNNFIFRDIVSKTLLIGKSNASSFTGFIYHFSLWNTPITDFSSQITNLCGSGLGSSCLWACDINKYYLTSSCTSCPTCTLGCRIGTTCNTCYNLLCDKCTGFTSGLCYHCVTHASVSSGSCVCDTNYIVAADGLSCIWGCTPNCSGCSVTLSTQCTSCDPGYYFLNGICFAHCPSGYTEDSSVNQCTNPPSSPIISIQLQNLIYLDTVNSFTVGTTASSYPNWDSSDPIPAIYRGYYFTTGSMMTSTSTYIISPWFTIIAWIKPTGQGNFLTQINGGSQILSLSFDSSGHALLSLLLEDSSSALYTSTSSLFNNWHNIAFSGTISTYKTSITFYKDGSQVSTQLSSNSSPFISSGSITIGKTGSNSFTGFLWSLIVYNDNTHALNEWISAGCPSGCSNCPSELLCPDSCTFTQFYSSSCTACSSSCSSYGCRSQLTCRLCKNKECLACDKFDGACSSCITNAQLISGACSCNDNSIWIQTSETCEICDNYCQTCAGTYYFECSSCIVGKFKVGNACINDCPTGFTLPGCVSSTSVVIDENFDTIFQGSYGIFTTASSSSSYYFYNTPETYDPIPAYYRGLYFSSGSYLESNIPIYLSHSFSVGLWVFVKGSGSVFQKQDFLYMNEVGVFTITLESPLQSTTILSTTTLTFTNWNYISLTVKYSLGSTTITVYLNNSPQTPVVSNNFIFRDIVSKTLLIGKSNTSSFAGFIYHFSLWNIPITDFSSQINNLCGTGLGSSCLWPCDINKYYSASSCTSCPTCTLGCRIGTTCNICYDLLCDKCTGFTVGLCYHCVTHASVSSGSCVCDTNYIVAADSLSCIWGCAPNCSECSGTLSTQCTSCDPSYYFLNGICYAHCPSGYTEDSSVNQCTSPPLSHIISIQLQNLIYLDTVNSFTVGATASSYPNWDSNDPIPAIYRGYYFKTGSMMTSTNSYIISSWFTIIAWLKPTGQGNFLTQINGGSQILSLSFDSSGHALLSLLLEDSSSALYTSTSSLFSSWHNIAFTGTIFTSKTSITFYKDGSQVSTQLSSNSSPFISSGSMTIGNTGSSNGFRGYLWSLIIYNDNTHALSEWISAGCPSGCSNCPSELLCPDSCTFTQFYSSGCIDCSSSCSSYGCRSQLTCRLCKQKECLACNKFDGSCSSCIPNASLSGGSCSCNTNAVWSQPTESCEICYSVCLTCNGLRFIDCTSCASGYFSLSNVCIQNCPSGYLQSAGNCALDTAGLNGFAMDLKLSQIKDIVIDSKLGIPFQTGDDNSFYPSYTNKDPYAAKYRGYYFKGSSYMKVPDTYASTIPSLIISPEFTIAIWINPTGSTGTLFTKQKNDATLTLVFSFGISSSNPTLSLLADTITISATSSNSVSSNSWNFIAATYKIDSTQTHKISFFINALSSDIHSISAFSWFQDITSSYYMTISASRTSTSFNSFYTGFLYELFLYNFITSPSSVFSTSCSSCSICPLSNTCYPTCSISQYWDGSSCIPCDTSCTSIGCKDPLSNCNLCQDSLCDICDDYASTCIQCITNAHLDTGVCVCDNGYFWDEVSLECTTCSAACTSCIQPSAFGCNQCSSGFYMTGYVCLKFCPLGYTQNGNVCKLANDLVYDMKFNKLTGVVYDSASKIPALTGNSTQFYTSYDYYDPLPAYLRGFYFNGNASIMHLPKYKNYTTPTLVLGPIFTFSAWINTESSTETIVYKSNHLSVGSSVFELKIVNDYPVLTLLMRGIQVTHQCENPITELSWQHIAFTLSTDSTRNSVITCFINTISDANLLQLSLQYFEDDGASISVKIGARQTTSSNYENFYKGFIYEIAIYNDVKLISDLALPTGSCFESCPACLTTKKCIPNCPILEYWKGPSFTDCGACNKNCTNSCRYSGPSCTLCGDILCYNCPDFDSSCIECKANSTFNSTCICDSPFGLDLSSESCSYCNTSQYRDSDGKCYDCSSNCTTCESANTCSSCIKDAIISNGVCVCKPGYNLSKNVCVLTYFHAILSVDYDNSLYLNFSESLNENLKSKDIEIAIFNKSKIEWAMEMRGSKQYYISILMDSDIKQNTTVTVYFTADQILSANNSILQEKNITGKLYEFNYVTNSSNVEAISQQTTVAIHISVATSLIMALINSDAACLWTTLNTLQVLSFITLSGIPLSSSLYSFLNSLNSYDVIPNLYETLTLESDGKTPYKEAKEFGYKTDLILINAGNFLTVLSAIMAVYPGILFFSQCSNKWFGKKFTAIMKHYKYSVFLRFWIQSYLDIGAPAIIGLLIFSYNNGTQIINAVICITLCLYVFVTPFILIFILYTNKYQIIKRKMPFLQRFDSLFYEFKPNQGMMSYQYYTIFFIRRLIYMTSLIFLPDIPIYQGLISIVLSVVTISYLIAYRPYSDFLHQFSNIFTEVVVGIVMILTTAFVLNLGDDAELWLEKIIYVNVALIMVTQIFASLTSFFSTIYTIVKPKIMQVINSENRQSNYVINEGERTITLDHSIAMDHDVRTLHRLETREGDPF